MEMYEAKGDACTPSKDGFVFTQTQINRASAPENRERLAKPTVMPSRGATTGKLAEYGA